MPPARDVIRRQHANKLPPSSCFAAGRQVVFAHRWLTTGTVILAEELATPQAHRYVPVVFLPSVPHAADLAARYGVTVIRTLTSIKAYGDLHTRLGPNSVLTYGPAWAGAMTEITEALSHITLDSPDPSPKLPFWDKAVGNEPRDASADVVR